MKSDHCRFYKIAGITVRLESELPITDKTFQPKFKIFEVDGPGDDGITIRLFFSIPEIDDSDLGFEVYRKPPWAIFKKDDTWIYYGIDPTSEVKGPGCLAVFNTDHTDGRIYNNNETYYRQGGLPTLTLLPTDQIVLARVLADRRGCYMHASGVALDGRGFIFVGQSEAGKSTTARMLKDKGELLCDERIIIRGHEDGFRIHGNWSHGEIPEISAGSAPLKAVMFLDKASENRLVPLTDKQEILSSFLSCLVRPFVTTDWWAKMLSVASDIVRDVPCYRMRFDMDGGIADLLREL